MHKGQGRATLEARTMTVVPGTVIYAPRQAWHGLRNTGTGALQITWVSAPGGLEGFFRERSRSGAAADAARLRELAQRHGIEFRSEGEPAASPVPRHTRRRRRRGGRGRRPEGIRQGQPSTGQPPQQAAAATPAPPPHTEPRLTTGAQATVIPSESAQREGGRRRRRHRRKRPGAPPPHQPSGQAPAAPPAKSGPTTQPAARRARPVGRRSRFSRVKEVYMGGRWIRVVGEGPVISTGHEPAEEDS